MKSHCAADLVHGLPWVVSGQFLLCLPDIRSITPAPGNHQEDFEARVLLGRGNPAAAYWDAEIAATAIATERLPTTFVPMCRQRASTFCLERN